MTRYDCPTCGETYPEPIDERGEQEHRVHQLTAIGFNRGQALWLVRNVVPVRDLVADERTRAKRIARGAKIEGSGHEQWNSACDHILYMLARADA